MIDQTAAPVPGGRAAVTLRRHRRGDRRAGGGGRPGARAAAVQEPRRTDRAKESARLFRSRLLSRRMAGRGGEQSRADGGRQGGGGRAGAVRRSGVRARGGVGCSPRPLGYSEARRERARAADNLALAFSHPHRAALCTGPALAVKAGLVKAM